MNEVWEWEEREIWLVWTKWGRRPKYVHTSEEAAKAEAIRLATRTPGKKYHVMKAVGKVHVPEKPKEKDDAS